MKNFRTYQLAVEFYKKSKKLNLKGNLKNQFERASSSIALNLAEGSGKFSSKDKCRFYKIAFGSLRECQSILTITENEESDLYNNLDILGASLYKLIKATR